MTETELWRRLRAQLGGDYLVTWAEQVVIFDLGSTVAEALLRGVPCVTIWRAVWRQLELEPKYF